MEDILENLELQLEHARAMAEHSPNVFLKASMNIASMEMFSVLNRFDTVTLSKRLEEKPELFFQLLNSYASLMRANLEQEKFEFKRNQAKARQRERQQKLRARKPILLTESTLRSIYAVVGRGIFDEPPSPKLVSADPQGEPPTKASSLPATPKPEPRIVCPQPASYKSALLQSQTFNTGCSTILEFSPPIADLSKLLNNNNSRNDDYADGSWQGCAEKPSDELACSPP